MKTYDLAKLLGVGHKIKAKDKCYELKPLTLGKQAEFVAWLKGRAWKHCFQATPHVTPEQEREIIRETKSMMDGGRYDWLSPVCLEAMGSPEGARELLRLAIATKESSPSEDELDDIVESLGEALKPILDEINGVEEADPNE